MSKRNDRKNKFIVGERNIFCLLFYANTIEHRTQVYTQNYKSKTWNVTYRTKYGTSYTWARFGVKRIEPQKF